MADEISRLAAEYVADNAASYDGQPDDQAAIGLAIGCRAYLEGKGWSPDEFNVDLDLIARNGLSLHRSN